MPSPIVVYVFLLDVLSATPHWRRHQNRDPLSKAGKAIPLGKHYKRIELMPGAHSLWSPAKDPLGR